MTEEQELKKAIHAFRGEFDKLTKDDAMAVVLSLDLGEDAFNTVGTLIEEAFRKRALVENASIIARLRVELVLRGENLHKN